jgi:hypothetical protein
MKEEKIRQIIQEELSNFLVRTIEVEKADRPEVGKTPKEGKIFEKVRVNVLEWFCSYLPYIEGALRGMQQDIEKTNNKITRQIIPVLETLDSKLIGHEDNLKQIAELAEKLKPILEISYDPKRLK